MSVHLKRIPKPDQLVITSKDPTISVVTNDGTSLAIAVCKKLLDRGDRVTLLTLPDTLVKKNPNSIPNGVQEIILQDLEESTMKSALAPVLDSITQLLYLHPGSESDFEQQKQRIKTIFLLAKHFKKGLNKTEGEMRNAFLTISRMDGAFGMTNPKVSSIVSGGLLGLTKSLNLEWPNIFCRAIDIAPEMNSDLAANSIEKELYDADQCLVESAYDAKGNRYTIATNFMPSLKEQELSSSINSDSVILVTGGAKGITADCVREVASTFTCKFILVGRSKVEEKEPEWAHGIVEENALKQKAMKTLLEQGEKPHPLTVGKMVNRVLSQREIKENLNFIKSQGSEVIYEAADITNTKALKTVIENATKILGPVTGLIHGAGRLADKLIENKSSADFDAVYDVKVKGLEAVLQSLSMDNINHIVLFSSVAGFYGNIGQTDYAIANEVLNRYAYHLKKQYPHIQTISINWGAWDAGMVSPQLKKIFEENNVSLVPTNEGPKALVDQLSHTFSNQEQVILGGTLPMAKAPVDGALRKYTIQRNLTRTGNSFLEHHAIKGNPVVPISMATVWMAQSAKDLYPGYFFSKVEDIKLFKGIVFDGSESPTYKMHVEELEKNSASIHLLVRVTSENTKLPLNHYQAIITLQSEKTLQPIIPKVDITSTSVAMPDASELYRDGTLFHGPDFQGIQQVLEITPEKIVLLCQHSDIPLERQGQFLVKDMNGFLIDIMYQGLLVWVRKYHSKACLPLKTEWVEVYENLPFEKTFCVSLNIIASGELFAEADVTAFDPSTGKTYLKSHKASVTISKELQWK